ncbi:hypothetical protein AMECASPLE_009767 [Ameca splendens]|uniref:Uncharacterized protein n=1 Tax=Ameca splendens TaxID=208324 RepID=A0ABV0ZK24_9TELE
MSEDQLTFPVDHRRAAHIHPDFGKTKRPDCFHKASHTSGAIQRYRPSGGYDQPTRLATEDTNLTPGLQTLRQKNL